MIQTDVAVEFTGIQIDQCYQLKSGITNKVSVQYDPTWSNFIEPSKFIELLGDFFEDFEKAVEAFGSASNVTESKEAATRLYESGQQIRNSSQDDDALTEADKVGSLAGFDDVLGYLDAYSTANARMAAECNWLCMYDKVKAAYNDYLGVYLTKINSVLKTDPTDGGFIPKGVYINNSATAFFCGMLDGAYIAVKDAGASAWNLGKVASCLNVTAF